MKLVRGVSLAVVLTVVCFGIGLLIPTLDGSGTAFAVAPAPRPGAYSAKAFAMGDYWVAGFDDPNLVASVPSPDGRSRVEYQLVTTDKEEHIEIRLRGALGEADFRFQSSPNYEIGWAPDSRAFFITENDGGVVGGYLLHVIGRYGGKLSQIDLTEPVMRAYGQPGWCGNPEEPNVAGLTWAGSSQRIIAIAQTLGHSNCDNMGTFKAYEVEVASRKILRTYGQIEAKAAFPEALGSELMGALDRCFTEPGSCHIPRDSGP